MFDHLVQLLSNPNWNSVAFWMFIMLAILVLVSMIEAIYRSRTPQSAMAWSMALAFMPILGLLIYFLFGRKKFKGYLRARDFRRNEISNIAKKTLQAIYLNISHKEDNSEALENILEMPFVKGNAVALLINAKDTYAAIFAAIDAAQEYILLTYYIVRDDEVGQILREKLEAKVRQNIKIYFIYDEVGSWSLAENYINSLKNAGVNIQPFHSTKGITNRFQINFRNHRKLVIIDGHTAFAGGINIGREYLGKKKRLSPWRDTHIKLTGPGALCAQLVFVEDWFWAASKIAELDWKQVPAQQENTEILLMATGPADKNLEACIQAYTYLFAQAKERIWITTPYFIPTQEILNSLNVAAASGVDVRVMIPKKTDGIFVKLSSFAFVLEALTHGVNVWRYKGFLHQKVLLIDAGIASVGSVNLDNRSFRLNFEANVLVRDRVFAQQVAQMLEKDFAESKQIHLEKEQERSIFFKFLTKAARLLAPIQ